nr:uncharacterized protein LOC111517662 [Leptinotarsa decemlineata]
MSARRRCPRTIYCDNGTNLRGASREIKEAMQNIDMPSIKNSMSLKGIDFKFLPPASPHMAGVWERLIGTVKTDIGKILYGQSLREETLQTLFSATESIVNCRPLTEVSCDPSDLEALTPMHFLLGYSNTTHEPTLLPISPDANGLRRKWKKSRMLVNTFWDRWPNQTVWVNNPLDEGSTPGTVMDQTGPYSYIVEVNRTPKRKHGDQLRPLLNQRNQVEQKEKHAKNSEKPFMICVSNALQDEDSTKESMTQPVNIEIQANDDIIQEEQTIFPEPRRNPSLNRKLPTCYRD